MVPGPEQAPKVGFRFRAQPGEKSNTWQLIISLVLVCLTLGYLIGYLAKDSLFNGDSDTMLAGLEPAAARILTDTSKPQADAAVITTKQAGAVSGRPRKTIGPDGVWPGDTVHTVCTSSGDNYQNFQTRIMYATYKLVQQMPGGERMTGFTRILHRTVPDILMEEIPTYHVWDLLKPTCDSWCDYPVANRPNAVAQFFEAAARNSSMIQGAWVLLIETDYIWMSPIKVPGSAYDPTVPRQQYLFDYIMPQHPDAAPHIQRLYGEGKDINDVPASGPAPCMMSLKDWFTIVPNYEAASARMELDQPMVKQLAWVREMYAWDVAVAENPQIKMDTLRPPNSTLIVQPPFDVSMANASMCHYTWGALYHENGKEIYRWEKRDYNQLESVIKPTPIKMPPPFKPGWKLEFDADLTEPRHNLVVEYLTQLNKGIATLPNISDRVPRWKAELEAWNKRAEERKKEMMEKPPPKRSVKYLEFSGIKAEQHPEDIQEPKQ